MPFCRLLNFGTLRQTVHCYSATAFPKTPPLMTSPKTSKQKKLASNWIQNQAPQTSPFLVPVNLPYIFQGTIIYPHLWRKSSTLSSAGELLGNMLTTPWRFFGCFLKWWYPPFHTPKWSVFVGKPMGLLGKPTILGIPPFLTVRFLQSHLPILQGFFIFSRVRAPLKIIQMLRFLRRIFPKLQNGCRVSCFPSKWRVLGGEIRVYLVYFHFQEIEIMFISV